MLTTPSDRFVRQADFVPADVLATKTVDVIGVGAIGRQVALQLTALGAPQVRLFDFDSVELTNVTTQGYSQQWDLNRFKVDATREAMQELCQDSRVEIVADHFRPRYGCGQVVFCCVDKIAARKAIWDYCGTRCEFFADGRMLGESLRLLTACDEASGANYSCTLFAQEEALAGRCTSQSTLYAASIAAGWLIHQFTRWLRGLPTDGDVLFSLLSSELTVLFPGLAPQVAPTTNLLEVTRDY